MRSLLTAVVAFSATISAASAASVTPIDDPLTVVDELAAFVSSSTNSGFNSGFEAEISAIGERIRFTYEDRVTDAIFDEDPTDIDVDVDLSTDPQNTPDIFELVRFTNNVVSAEPTVYRIDIGLDGAPGNDTNPFTEITVRSWAQSVLGLASGTNFSTRELLLESETLFIPLTQGDVFDIEAIGIVGAGNNFSITVTAVPVPAAGVLFGSALLGAAALRRRKLQQKLGLPQ